MCPCAGSSAPQQSSRPAVLFAAAAALAHRLQSIFVPYFRYLLEPLVAALEGAPPGAPPPKKKRRKSAAADGVAATDSAPAATTDSATEAALWQLRMQVSVAFLPSCTKFFWPYLDHAAPMAMLPSQQRSKCCIDFVTSVLRVGLTQV